jgi:hypothetical protein
MVAGTTAEKPAGNNDAHLAPTSAKVSHREKKSMMPRAWQD